MHRIEQPRRVDGPVGDARVMSVPLEVIDTVGVDRSVQDLAEHGRAPAPGRRVDEVRDLGRREPRLVEEAGDGAIAGAAR